MCESEARSKLQGILTQAAFIIEKVEIIGTFENIFVLKTVKKWYSEMKYCYILT